MKIEGKDSTLNFKGFLVVKVNNIISVINEPENELHKCAVLHISHTNNSIITSRNSSRTRLYCNKKRKTAEGKM
jgi:hypothetical protein